MATNRRWKGTMKLSNVVREVAYAMGVPPAALKMQFLWTHPHSGRVLTLADDEEGRITIGELRLLWAPPIRYPKSRVDKARP